MFFFLSKGSSKEIKNRKEFERKENISFFSFFWRIIFHVFQLRTTDTLKVIFFVGSFFGGEVFFQFHYFMIFLAVFLEVFSIFLVIFCSKFLLIFFGLFCITIFYGFFCAFLGLFSEWISALLTNFLFFLWPMYQRILFFSCKFWKLSSLQKLRRGFHLLWHDEFIANVGREKNLKN